MPELVSGTLNKTGVYQIRNTVNNKLYVGSTTQGFFQRWRDHIRELLKTQELTQEQIAMIFGVSRKAISDIKLYKTWRSNG